MPQPMTAAAHRERALDLLNESYGKGVASPARSVILAEAQIHATLALSLSAPAEEKKPAARRKPAAKVAAPAPEEEAAK